MFAPFSVSMCVYGGDNPAWFRTAVDSILNQSVKPSEVVLVVDGPVPQTMESVIVEYEAMPFFKVIRLPKNKGHGEARRIGLENCSHELVALMDADDISMFDRFEKQLDCFRRNPELSVLGGIISEFMEDKENVVGYRVVPSDHDKILKYMKTRCPMNQVTVMFRKSEVLKAGGYQDWYCNEDYYLWLRMYLQEMKFGNVPDVLVNVRTNRKMYQRRGGWRYFVSEWKLQNYMLMNSVIGPTTYGINVMKRLIVQVLLPNRIRGYIFRSFTRDKEV